MGNYDQLVKALMTCSGNVDFPSCVKCGYNHHAKCKWDMMLDAAAAIEELQAEVGQWKAAVKGQEDGIKVLQAEVERYVQINTDQLSRIGYLQKRLCDWCAVCPVERRNPDDCELILDPVTYGPSEYTSTDWATVQQPGGDG